jgi:hypothetical protein
VNASSAFAENNEAGRETAAAQQAALSGQTGGVIKARSAPQKIESTQTRQAAAAGRAMGVVFMAGSLGWVDRVVTMSASRSRGRSVAAASAQVNIKLTMRAMQVD